MKNLLALFLILLTLNFSLCQIKRFAYTEEITLAPFGKLTASKTSVFDTCRPVFNNEKVLDKNLSPFKLSFELVLDRLSLNSEAAMEVNIFDGPIDSKSTPTLYETCMTSFERHRFDYQITVRVSCMTREFKKNYVVAVCLKNRNTSWSNQLTRIRVAGYNTKD